jgi:hypothetical protein
MTRLCAALFAAAILAAGAAQAASAPAPCETGTTSHALDFWIGDWSVYVGSTLAGRDVVTLDLDGCAVIEDWTEADGSGRGKSLFYFDARKDFWTQVWVTGDTSRPGGLKQKFLRRRTATSVTFQGEIEGKSGAIYYDRTTLTDNRDGTVRQLIEVSHDGAEWMATFDAIYRRNPPKAA